MSAYDSFIGQTFEDRYTIVNVIGKGGMATVYGAYDRLTGRSVAIKMMNKKLQNNEKQIKLFLNESTALSLLSHPNIVQVYNTVTTNSTKYIIMEYVEGITLKKHIDHRGALPEREVIYYATQILSALSYIHSKGIVHCDIKPQNIILLPNGNIKVADFGIARLDAMLDNSKEKSDVALGTVYYVSPEQAQGKAPQAQSDIYSLGVMLYEAMTNRLPFVHDSVDEVARMQINKDPLPPSAYRPEMSIGLEQIILRAMEKSTKNRYASAQEMLTDIRALRQNEKIIFGNEKRSRYRIIDREVYANVPNISNRSFIPLNDKGRGIENNQGAFGRAQRNTSSGTYGSTLKATSSSIRAAQDRSFEISQKNNAPQKNKVNDPQIKEPQRADIQKSKRNSVINDKDIISILLGIIISLAIVIFLSLCIWFIISPGKIACENPQYSITETENNIKWNTEHTERY